MNVSLEDRPEIDHAALARIKAAMMQGIREITVRRTRTGRYDVLVLVPAPSYTEHPT